MIPATEVSRPPRRSALRGLTSGLPLFPLAVLFLLFFFDEWDTAAFNVLAPNIQSAFGLSDRSFGLLVILNLSIVLLAAIPVGYYGDRLPRVRLVTVGAVVAGVFSLLTGVAGGVLALALFRLGNGVGRLVNDPIHSSLLSDYYLPADRGRIYAVHRNAQQLALVIGPAVAGIVAAFAGWRAAFMVLIGPILLTALLSLRLREPARGATEDREGAIAATTAAPVPFGEAKRTLFAVPTLSRQYVGFFFVGAGLIPLAFLGPIYLHKAFGLSELGRGLVVALDGAAAVAGIVVAGRLMPRWTAKHPGEPIRRAGLALVVVGVSVVATAYAPTLWLAIVLGVVGYAVGGVFTPPYVATLASVSPARVRSLSFAMSALFLLAGVWVLYLFVPVSTVADTAGIRPGLAVTAPYWIVGGLIIASAKGLVPRDIEAAVATLKVLTRLRAEREAAAAGGQGVLLSCHGLSAAYDGVPVLFGVDFAVREGEIVALLGTNGAGKSTVLKAITGLLDPTGGLIVFEGRDITHADPLHTTALGIAQMPGGRGIFPTLTVEENLTVAAWRVRERSVEARATAEVYDTFPQLRERRQALAGNLSGGEQQMLALGMAFLTRPKLLLIDELSLGLAPVVVSQLADTVRRINQSGVAVVIVEQSLNIALTLADRAYFLERGEVRFAGPTTELLGHDDLVRSVFLSGAVAGNRTAEPQARPATRRNAARVSAPVTDAGKEVSEALATERVSVSFGGISAIAEVSITISPGEIVGVIGPNGAGKTTLVDVVSGHLPPDRGRVCLRGRDITHLRPDQRARCGLGRSFQDARIFPSLTVAENLALAFDRHLEIRDHLADALGLPAVREQEEDVAYSVSDLVELMSLGAYRDKFVAELSTGSRRIVDLAMCLAHDPDVLILDEPSSGIAQRESEALAPLLRQVRDETGCALLVIEHDIPLIAELSDRLIALDQGRVIAEGEPHRVLSDQRVVTSYLGGDPAAIARSGPRRPAPSRPAARTRRRTATAVRGTR